MIWRVIVGLFLISLLSCLKTAPRICSRQPNLKSVSTIKTMPVSSMSRLSAAIPTQSVPRQRVLASRS